jgi:hypothetical protein
LRPPVDAPRSSLARGRDVDTSRLELEIVRSSRDDVIDGEPGLAGVRRHFLGLKQDRVDRSRNPEELVDVQLAFAPVERDVSAYRSAARS